MQPPNHLRAYSAQQLREICRRWQQRLRLLDWQIEVRTAPAAEMEGDVGSLNFDHNKKRALIRLIEPAEFPADAWIEHDQETTIVHELLELHQSVYTEMLDDHQEKAKEFCIEAVSDALVELSRQCGRSQPAGILANATFARVDREAFLRP